jgi:hypothetical protein
MGAEMGPDSDLEWRGRIRGILYGVPLGNRVDANTLDLRVDLILKRSRWGKDPEEDYTAMVAALGSGRLLAEDEQHEDAVRDALAGMVRRLDERRPWPPPPFVGQDAARWSESRAAPVVGRIRRSMKNIEAAFSLRAEAVGSGADRSDVLVVLMRSGPLVALREKETLVGWVSDVHSTGDPAAVRAEITAATGLTVDPP